MGPAGVRAALPGGGQGRWKAPCEVELKVCLGLRLRDGTGDPEAGLPSSAGELVRPHFR